MALPRDVPHEGGPTPFGRGVGTRLRGMSFLVRGLRLAKSQVSFSLRSARTQTDVDSSFGGAQGGIVVNVND